MDQWIRESNRIEDIFDPNEDARSQKAWNWFKDQDLTIPNILKLHKRITWKQLGKEAGNFRTCRVWVGHREGAPWSHVPMLMQTWFNTWKIGTITTLKVDEEWLRASHVNFEHIHPFIDGNGRTGRMIMQWQRVKAGLKPLLIKAKERQSYYEWF